MEDVRRVRRQPKHNRSIAVRVTDICIANDVKPPGIRPRLPGRAQLSPAERGYPCRVGCRSDAGPIRAAAD